MSSSLDYKRNVTTVIEKSAESAAGDSTADPLASYYYAIKRKKTKRQYTFKLRKYFDYLAVQGADLQDQAARFLAQAGKDHNWAQRCLVSFITHLKKQVEDKEISGGTLKNYYAAIKLFYEQNDIELNWKKISRGLPEVSSVANDRAPTLEELRKLIEAPDPRVKVIVLVMISSGVRLSAWDNLKVKHLTPIPDPKNPNVVIAARLKVYDGDTNPYNTFISGEAYQAVQQYLEFRRSYGEQITDESWILRDKFPTTPNDMKHAARKSLATNPIKLEVQGVSKVLRTALYVQGLRDLLPEGEHRHAFKLSHGFRKYYKSNAERVMRPLNVELLMDHKTGVSDSYWRPTEHDLQEDYIKAINYLSVVVGPSSRSYEEEKRQLQQQQKEVQELRAFMEESRASFENWKKYVYRLVELNTGVALKSEQDVKEFLQRLKEEEKK